jgi:hypothetical protein
VTKTILILEIDSQCHLTGAISSVLRSLRSAKDPEPSHIVDLRSGWARSLCGSICVVQNVRKSGLEPHLHPAQ